MVGVMGTFVVLFYPESLHTFQKFQLAVLKPFCWWTFRIFFFVFCSGEGKGESEGPGGGGGGQFFMESPRRGGSPRLVGVGGRGAGRVFEGIWGGGPKYLFFGAEIPTKFFKMFKVFSSKCLFDCIWGLTPSD